MLLVISARPSLSMLWPISWAMPQPKRLLAEARKDRIGAYVDELTAYVDAQNITSGNAQTKCLNVTELSTPTVLLSLPPDPRHRPAGCAARR
mgnify:CR=1 FL=1